MVLSGLMKKLFDEEGHKSKNEQAEEIIVSHADRGNKAEDHNEDDFMIEEENNDFLLKIEDTFALKEKGCVIAGKVISGSVQAGDIVIYADEEMEELFECRIEAIEQNHYAISQAVVAGNYGAHYGFLIADHDKEAFQIGNYLLLRKKES